MERILINRLTPREIDVLRCMAEERTIAETALSLYIGRETVISHRRNIMRKLEAKNAIGVIVKAFRGGVLK